MAESGLGFAGCRLCLDVAAKIEVVAGCRGGDVVFEADMGGESGTLPVSSLM